MKRLHINVVVTCAARKTKPASAQTRVKNLKSSTLNERFTEWSMQINRNNQNPVKAIDLYRGNSWSIIRKLQQHPKHGKMLRLWVVSAGYGLISAETLVAPYAATFVDGHADSVRPSRPREYTTADWWNKLIQWRRERYEVGSIADIAKNFPDQPLLIAISKEYLAATHEDIVEAREFLSSPDKMVIICTGAKKNGKVVENFLPCDARFENHYHCCRADLNASLLDSIVKSHRPWEISASKLRISYAHRLSKMPKVAHPKRARFDDLSLKEFITLNLLKRSVSHSNLLKLLRSEGCACEQNRFRKLFAKVKNELQKKGAL